MDIRYNGPDGHSDIHLRSLSADDLRSHIIAMVADGNLRLVEMTIDGPRFEYTSQARRSERSDDKRRVEPALKICAIVACWIVMFLVLEWLRS